MVVGDRLFTSLEANRNRSRQNVQQQLLRAHLGRLALGPKEQQSDERQGADAGDVEREQDIDREGGKRARRLLGRTVQDRGDREIAKERRQPDRRLTSWPQQQRAERRRKRPDHDRAGVDEAPQAELEQEREYDHQPKYQKGQNAQRFVTTNLTNAAPTAILTTSGINPARGLPRAAYITAQAAPATPAPSPMTTKTCFRTLS